MRRNKKQNYWTAEDERLVIQYQHATDLSEKSTIYNQLRPKLVTKMYSSIVLRYFSAFIGHLSEDEIKLMVSDCESAIIENSIHNFKSDNGTAYAYLGTCARNYFFDRLCRQPQRMTLEPLEPDEDGNYKYDVAINEETENVDELFLSALKQIQLLRRIQFDEFKNTLLEIIETFLMETPGEYYSKHYSTYYLLMQSGLMSAGSITRHLKAMGIDGFVFAKFSVKHYLKLFESKGIDPNNYKQVREYLSTMKQYEYKKAYPVENGSEQRANKKKQKQKIRLVSQDLGLTV